MGQIPRISRNLNNRLFAFFLLAVAVRLTFHLYTSFVADDAFITFRYARNLAAGIGFVYNQGEYVLGTSTPFYTFLLALLNLIRFPLPVASLILSMVASGLTAICLYRFALSLRFTSTAFIPVILYIFWPRSIVGDSTGMETSLFGMFIIWAFYFQHKEKRIYAVAAASLATVTRPEGLLLLFLLLVYDCYRFRTEIVRLLAVPAFLLLPWTAFATYYFGSPIPNTIPAKLALYSRFGTEPVIDKLIYLLALNNPAGILIIVAAILGSVWLHRKQNFGRIEIIWLALMISFYAFSNTRLFFWYIPPLYPVLLLVASGSIPLLFERLKTLTPFRSLQSQQWVLRTLTIVLIIVAVLGTIPSANYYRAYQTTLERVHQKAGFYLYVNASKESLVAAEDIGYLGFYSKRRILDRDGLVSPVSIEYNRKGKYGKLIADLKPDYLCAFAQSEISPFLNDSLFLNNYKLENTFDSGMISEYRIYSRDNKAIQEGNRR